MNSKGRRWFVNASSCQPNPQNPLLGKTRFEFPAMSATVHFTDLHFDYVTLNQQQLCFDISVKPHSVKHENMTAMSDKFHVVKRLMYLAVNTQPGDANETIVFGKQPVIEVMDLGTRQPAHPLREAWDVTVSIATNPNSGVLSGTKTVSVNGTKAAFKDLELSSYGVGYALKFTSNHGDEVSNS